MKKLNKALNILAFVFVVGLLFNTPWQDIYVNLNFVLFFVSLAFCLLGFFFQALNWFFLLRLSSLNVSFKDAICSVGVTIFAKYIPGKLWMILGRASYIAERYPESLKKIGSFSLFGQVISLVVASIISVYILFQLDFPLIDSFQSNHFILSLLALIVTILFLIFCSINWGLGFNSVLTVSIISSLMWFFWGCGFAFLYLSMNLDLNIPFSYLVVVFTFSALLGILALIVPGGIGVREAGIVSVLGFLGLPLELSISVAALSRVWFLLAESIFFAICRYSQ